MNLRSIITIGASIICLMGSAQEATMESEGSTMISSDRPGQTYSSATLSKGAVQFQAGYTGVFSKDEIFAAGLPYNSNSVEIKYHDRFSAFDARIGLFDKLELGFGVGFSSTVRRNNYSAEPDDVDKTTKKYPILPRFTVRYQIDKNVPLVIMYTKDFYGKRTASDKTTFVNIENGHTFRLSSSHTFSSGTGVAANFAVHLNEDQYFNSYTLNINQAFVKWGVYFELFGDSYSSFLSFTSTKTNKPKPMSSFDLGVFWQPGDNVLFDFSYGKIKDFKRTNLFAVGITIQPSK